MNTDLRTNSILITGASGGIGLATARAFADEGARLTLNYHTQKAPIDALQQQIDSNLRGADANETEAGYAEPSDPRTLAVQADLRDEAQVDALFAQAIAAFGRIDTIVVNAGVAVLPDVPLHEMSTEQWRSTLVADLDSAFFTCRAFLRHLAADPREAASIVLVGSTAALFGEAGNADYSAAKAAMTHGLTLTLKNEIVHLAPRGRVNCVCPGWTRTPMAAHGLRDAATVARVQATMPLQKVAEPEDIANAIVYLASDRLAGHLSGTILPIAGGMEGRLLRGELR